MRKLCVLLSVLSLSAIAGATVTSTASTVAFTCTNSTGPFPFTFPALDIGSLRVIEQNPADAAGVMTVLASNQWTATPVNGSYANGGSVTLVTACPTGYTLTIARATEPTQLTQYTPYMPALYANVEANLDQLTIGRQDTYRVDQLHIGAVTGTGTVSVTQTPLGQYLNLGFPGPGGPFCLLSGPCLIAPGKLSNPWIASNVVNVSLLPNPVLGDGSDQTANMQTAANLCGAGRSLYLPPPSSYYHWISVNVPDNCAVLGEPGASLIMGTPGTSYVDGTFVLGDHATVKYLNWIGTAQSQSVTFHALQLASNAASTASVTSADIRFNWFNNVNIGLYVDRGQAGVPPSGITFDNNFCNASQYCAFAVRVMDSDFSYNHVKAGIELGGYTATALTYTGAGPYTISGTTSTPITGLNPPDLVQIMAQGFVFTTKVNPCTLTAVSGNTFSCTTNVQPTTASGTGTMYPSPLVGSYTILSASYTGSGPTWLLTLNLDPATAVTGAVVGDAVQLVMGSGPNSGIAPFILTDPAHPCILASISGTTVTCTSTLQPTYATYTSPGPETFGTMKLPQPQTTYAGLAFNSAVRTRRNFNVIDGGYIYNAGRSFAIVGIIDIPRFDVNIFSNANLGFFDNQTLGNQISGIGQEHISADIYGNNAYRSNVSEMSTVVSTQRSAGFYQVTLNHQAVYSNLTSCTSTSVPPAYTIYCTLPSWSASSGGATGYSGPPTVNQGIGIQVPGFLVTGGYLECTVTASSATDFSCTWNGAAPLASSGTGGTVSEGFQANYLGGQWMCFNTGTMNGSCYQITNSTDTTNVINVDQADFANISTGDQVTLGWPFIHNQISNNFITMPTPLVTPYTVTASSYTGSGPWTVTLTLSTAITGTVLNDAVQLAIPGFLSGGFSDPCITLTASGTTFTCTSQTQPASSSGTGTMYTANVGQIGTYGIGFHGFSYRNIVSDNTVIGNNWAVAVAPDRDRGTAFSVRSLGGLQAVGSYTYNTFNFHVGMTSGNILSNNIGSTGSMRLTGYDYHTHTYLTTVSTMNRVDAFKGSSILVNAQIPRVDGTYWDNTQPTPSVSCTSSNLGSQSYYNPASGSGTPFTCVLTGTGVYSWQPNYAGPYYADFMGDSITQGTGATQCSTVSSATGTCWAGLVAAQRGYTWNHVAAGGSAIGDVSLCQEYNYASCLGARHGFITPSLTGISFLLDGQNDSGAVPSQPSTGFFNGTRAMSEWQMISEDVAYFALTPNKIFANSANCTQGGSWVTSDLWTLGGLKTTTNGSTLTCTVLGTTALVSVMGVVGNSSNFTITIDGTAVTSGGGTCCTFALSGASNILANTAAGMLFRFPGLIDTVTKLPAPGPHAIVITANVVGGNPLYLNWVDGNTNEPANGFGPVLYRMTPYGSNGQTEANGNLPKQRQFISIEMNDLQSDGFNEITGDLSIPCYQQPVGATLTNLCNTLDGTHPSPAGHQIIANYVNQLIDQTQNRKRVNVPSLSQNFLTTTPQQSLGSTTSAGVNTPLQFYWNNQPEQPACAMAADPNINPQTPSSGTSTATTLTLNFAGAVPNFYRVPGLQVIIAGAVPSGWNGTWPILSSPTTTSMILTSTANPGNLVTPGQMSISCANQVNDALQATQVQFPNGIVIPANAIGTTLLSLSMRVQYIPFAPASSATGPTLLLYYGTSTNPASNEKIYQSVSNLVTNGTNNGANSGTFGWDFTAEPNLSLMLTPSTLTGYWSNAATASFSNGVSQPVVVAPGTRNNVYFAAYYPATGTRTATYVSGGAGLSGTGTCALASFNGTGGTGAAGSLTITAGTPGAITMTNTGQAYTGTSTAATLGACTGSAAGTGTIVITSTLGGAQGNALMPYTLVGRP